jgi:DNA mismatch repair ATPase MutS
MDEVKVDKQYFDIEIDENDTIKSDYKIKPGVSRKHLALKLLKKKGFYTSIINDAEYLYEKLQGGKKEEKNGEKVEKEVVIEEKPVVVEEVVVDSMMIKEVNEENEKDEKEENKKISRKK